jgi:hypothetical protein
VKRNNKDPLRWQDRRSGGRIKEVKFFYPAAASAILPA